MVKKEAKNENHTKNPEEFKRLMGFKKSQIEKVTKKIINT